MKSSSSDSTRSEKRPDPAKSRLIQEFGVNPALVEGADPLAMALVLEDLTGQGAQQPQLTAREQLLLDAARRPVAGSGERLGDAMDRAFIRDVIMPELELRSMLTTAEPDATRVAPRTAPGLQTPAAPAVLESVAQQLGSPESILERLGLPGAMPGRNRTVRGAGSQTNVLDLLRPAPLSTKESGKTPNGDKEKPQEAANASLASLLPVLGIGALVAALVARGRGKEDQQAPAAAGRDPMFGSLERGGRTTTTIQQPTMASQLFSGIGNTLSGFLQAKAGRQEQDRQIAEQEQARRQELGIALLRAGSPQLALNFLGPDNPELQEVNAEQIKQLQGSGKDFDSLLELGQIVSRIGGPEEKRAWLQEAWGAAGLPMPASGITIDPDVDPMPASMERWMLENGIDPGDTSRLDPETRRQLLRVGRAASQRETEDARFEKLHKFTTMVEKAAVAGLVTPGEASAMKENVLPELQAVAKSLGKTVPLPADSEGGNAPNVPTTTKVPTAEVIADLRADAPRWYGKGRAWTEAKLNELAEEPGNPQIKAELDRLFGR